MTGLRVRPGGPEEARALIEASHALMAALFPAASNHFLPLEALAGPAVRFFVAEEGGAPLGCGAVALKDGWGEVKSMFTAEEARGRGIGGAVLDAIEAAARAEGLTLLRLETGTTLDAARRLYERHGFARCAPFAGYVTDPNSVFYERAL
jgi:putative acetyltransferase